MLGWLRDRASRLPHVFNPNWIIIAIFVVAVVLLTRLPLQGGNANLRIVDVVGGRSGRFWAGQPSDGYMRQFGTELRKPLCVVGKNVAIDDRTPNKNARFAVPVLFQHRFRNIPVSGILRLWADGSFDFVIVKGELVAFRQILRPIMNTHLDHYGSSWSVAAIYKIEEHLLTCPFSLWVDGWPTDQSHPETWPRKSNKRSFGTSRGIVGSLGYVIHHVSEYRQDSGKKGGPNGGPSDKQEIPYSLKHVWDFLLCCVCVFSFIAFIGTLLYAAESSRWSFLLLAVVWACLWYLAVIHIRI